MYVGLGVKGSSVWLALEGSSPSLSPVVHYIHGNFVIKMSFLSKEYLTPLVSSEELSTAVYDL